MEKFCRRPALATAVVRVRVILGEISFCVRILLALALVTVIVPIAAVMILLGGIKLDEDDDGRDS